MRIPPPSRGEGTKGPAANRAMCAVAPATQKVADAIRERISHAQITFDVDWTPKCNFVTMADDVIEEIRGAH